LSALSDDESESRDHRIAYRLLNKLIDVFPAYFEGERRALDALKGNGADASPEGGTPWMAPDSGLNEVESDEGE
jgi:hypothetical protein